MIGDRLLRALEAPLVVREGFRALDAIVVLGAPLGPRDRLTPPLVERARAAADLYRRGGAPLVIASGGITRGAARAEADALADEIRAAGVPSHHIVVERESQSTRDNAHFTAALLEKRGRTPRYARESSDVSRTVSADGGRPSQDRIGVWLVTQPFHGRRAQRLFQRAGFDAHVWHIDDSIEYRDRRRAARWVMREYASWAAMLVRDARSTG